MPNDLAEIVGENAQKIENRSLLADKFAYPKQWLNTDLGKGQKANRWSLMRLSSEGRRLLAEEGEQAKRKASKGGDSKIAQDARLDATVLPALANLSGEASDAQRLRAAHTRRMLGLVRSMPKGTSATICARLESRLAINLSEGLVENGGISLDRIFGLPLIPGSALKGCARHAALAELAGLNPNDDGQLNDAFRRFVRVFGCATNDFSGKNAALAPYGTVEEAGIPGNGGDLKGGATFLPASPLTETNLEVDLSNAHVP